ncbi:hypothetical protein QBC34DRAFT_465219 [Podospora aff. communis PSN243]|uniref:FAD-binding PCMH-type domain-containing protein n=1 Tax=Podospora aff. communis PSN243 TaxID=3040156 RepID=A0AAV9H645_9PEZI|nr:hypothetical protein QBC34DRAFT_465219 [Podospora aff. communis PSN243]
MSVPPQAACLVEAGLQSRILLPSDAEYSARQDSYWSNSAKLKPACIIAPRSTEEVSAAVKALVKTQQRFAIRSGGHTNWPGSNNTDGGVTIDLGFINSTSYGKTTEVVSIGPGAKWREVYRELHQHGRAVAGGREGNVGVAGLLLGGGNTFFTARRGFACDNVVAYEVVLADGSIITADNHADLFRALKGGSNNFGIVTRFDMTAIPTDRVWGGMTFFPKDKIPSAIDAMVTFTDNVEKDPDSNLVCIFTYMPNFQDIVIATLYAQMAGVENAPAYEKWLGIPEMMDTVKMTSISDMAFEYNIPSGYYTTWFTMCFKNDTRILTKASSLHNGLVEELKRRIPEGDFITQCLFQPLPKLFGQRSVAAGGNVMGAAFAQPMVKEWIDQIREFASTIEGGVQDWVYLNYADGTQDPIGSYGAENVQKIREVAAKYDPLGAFQTLCPGGFKLSRS